MGERDDLPRSRRSHLRLGHRLTWILRQTGDEGLQRAVGALAVEGLRAKVFRFFLAAPQA